jgi:hypothetical protein
MTARVRLSPRTIGRPSDCGTKDGNSGSSEAVNSSDRAFPTFAATTFASASETISCGVPGGASIDMMKFTRQSPSIPDAPWVAGAGGLG